VDGTFGRIGLIGDIHAEDERLWEALDDSTRAMLAALPVTLEIATVGGPALLCHGIGSNDMSKLNPDDHGYAVAVSEELQELLRTRRHRWVLNGHSHKRMVRHFPGLTMVNAGTLKRGEEAGFFELDFAAGVARLFEFEGPGVVPALEIPLFP